MTRRLQLVDNALHVRLVRRVAVKQRRPLVRRYPQPRLRRDLHDLSVVLATQSLVGLGLGVAVIGGVGIFAAFGFEAASTRFHELFFTNDLWLLDPERDHLIQMFPEAFWRDITIVLGTMCALEAALIGAIAGIYVVSTRGERRRDASAIDVNASSTQAA